MITAILIDGSKTPVSILLKPSERTPSLSWGGSATNPARHFNFVRAFVRDERQPAERQAAVYRLVGLKSDAVIPGLHYDGSKPVTVTEQAARMADEFLYPERYAEVSVAAQAV